MDSPDPSNLYLVYDKYEKSFEGIPFDQFLGYKEYINAVPAYNYVVEESEVIDPSSSGKRVYSTQLYSHKEVKLLKSNSNDEGWKIVTPKKAIQDPRTFQNFNWRLLAKINYDFKKNKDTNESAERATLKVGVLYSGLIENIENPYVFANLEESVINQQNFLFENHLAPLNTAKNQRAYWSINIDEFIATQVNSGNADAFLYDFLVWTPTSKITEHQKRTIDMFLSNGVSIFIDCSSLDQTSIAASGLSNFDFTLSAITKNTGLIKITDEYVEGDETLNAWDMNQYNESSVNNFGVFGDRKNIFTGNSVNPIRVFSGMPESQDGSARSIVYIADGSNNYAAMLKDKYNSAAEFSAFSVFCVNPFLTFINDNYGGSGLPVSGKNKGATNSFSVGRAGSQTGLLSESVIGPSKLFYNIICETNRNKVNSREVYSDNSVVVWNISPWRNSWTINGKPNSNGNVDVLFDDEKKTFNFSFKQEQKEDGYNTLEYVNYFCREINSSIGDLLIQDFEATSNQLDAATMINSDFSNVEFYIECSNDNVKFLNFSSISNQDYLFADVKTSYSIQKMSSAAKSKIGSAPLSLDAYSIVYSKQFDIDSIYYPYVILDYSDYVAQVNSVIKTPNEYLPGSQFVRDYDYAFKTQLFVTEVKTNRYNYEVNWSTPYKVTLDGSSGSITVTTKKAVPAQPDGSNVGIYGAHGNDWAKYPPIPVTNRESPFHLYRYPTNVYSVTDILNRKFKDRTHTRNNFHYTNDLPITSYWDEYMLGKSGPSGSAKTSGSNPQYKIVTTTKTVTIPGEYDFSGPVILAKSNENKAALDNLLKTGGLFSWKKVKDYDKLWWVRGLSTPVTNDIITLEDAFIKWEIQLNNLLSSIPSQTAKNGTVTTINQKQKLDIIHELWLNDIDGKFYIPLIQRRNKFF